MKSLRFATWLCLLLAFIARAAPASPRLLESHSACESGEIIVRPARGLNAQSILPLNRRFQATIADSIPQLGLFLVRVKGDTQEALAAYRASPAVEAAELNYQVRAADLVPEDPMWDAQWNLRRIGAPDSSLGDASDAGAFWTVPVRVGLVYHF